MHRPPPTFALPRRAALAALPALLLGACAGEIARIGLGDPVRAAAFEAPALMADTSRLSGDPVAAARAAWQLELLTQAFESDPVLAPAAAGGALHQMRRGRAEMRQAIGIAADAPPGMVLRSLEEAEAALQAGSIARAAAALDGPAFPAGGEAALRRLSTLPRLPEVARAAAVAGSEVRRIQGGERRAG